MGMQREVRCIMNNPYPIDWHRLLRGVFLGVLIGEAGTVLLLFVFSCIMAFVNLPLAAADWMAVVAFCIGAAVGGYVSAMIAKNQWFTRWLFMWYGFCVLMVLITLVFHPFEATSFFLFQNHCFIAAFCGWRDSWCKPETSQEKILIF